MLLCGLFNCKHISDVTDKTVWLISVRPLSGQRHITLWSIFSGDGTNLKVCGRGGGSVRKFFLSSLFTFFCFLALQVQSVVLVNAFMMVSIQFGQFLVCSSSTHNDPPCPAICKSGGHVPPHSMESGPLDLCFLGKYVSCNYVITR